MKLERVIKKFNEVITDPYSQKKFLAIVDLGSQGTKPDFSPEENIEIATEAFLMAIVIKDASKINYIKDMLTPEIVAECFIDNCCGCESKEGFLSYMFSPEHSLSNFMKDKDKEQFFYLAASRNYLNVVKAMIAAHLRNNFIGEAYRKHVLASVAALGYMDIVKLILDNFEFSKIEQKLFVYMAVRADEKEIGKLLLGRSPSGFSSKIPLTELGAILKLAKKDRLEILGTPEDERDFALVPCMTSFSLREGIYPELAALMAAQISSDEEMEAAEVAVEDGEGEEEMKADDHHHDHASEGRRCMHMRRL